MKRLTLEQVLAFHEKMIKSTGGSAGLRNKSLLDSAISNAYATFEGNDLYQSVEEKCANICYNVVKSHPFIDGNKRMGVYIMLILLEYSGIKLLFKQSELVEFGLGIAEGKLNQSEIVDWIQKHRV